MIAWFCQILNSLPFLRITKPDHETDFVSFFIIIEALEAGFEVVLFEQMSELGGNWVFKETECHASVYRSTVINTSKHQMCFSDL